MESTTSGAATEYALTAPASGPLSTSPGPGCGGMACPSKATLARAPRIKDSAEMTSYLRSPAGLRWARAMAAAAFSAPSFTPGRRNSGDNASFSGIYIRIALDAPSPEGPLSLARHHKTALYLLSLGPLQGLDENEEN